MSEIANLVNSIKQLSLSKFRITLPDGTQLLRSSMEEVKETVEYYVNDEKVDPEDITLELKLWQKLDLKNFLQNGYLVYMGSPSQT